MTTALDSSVLIAAVAGWHERHDDCHRVVAALLSGGDPPVVPNHALVETFSVLTRLPVGYRISPRAAGDLLQGALRKRIRLSSGRRDAPWSLIASAAELGVAGGAIYDLRILRSALAAGATRLLTLNPRDFERFEVDGIEIVAL